MSVSERVQSGDQWTLAGSSAWYFCFHRQGHRPLPARRGAARLDGDGGKVAAGAAEAELEVELTVPSCTHKHSLGSGSEHLKSMVLRDCICDQEKTSRA